MNSRLLALISILALASELKAQTVYFVDDDLASGANDGGSWDDAFRGPSALQTALGISTSGDSIYVAQGTYKPTTGTNRNRSFVLRDGVSLFGSFLGTESSPEERPRREEAPTILSGDLLGNDGTVQFDWLDNCYHVLRSATGDQNTAVDGFIVTGGVADGGGNPLLWRRYGGGMLITDGASPTVSNCTFVGNKANYGGAVYVRRASGIFIDCLFEKNRAASNPGVGGVFSIFQADGLRIQRCAFRDNYARSVSTCDFADSVGVEVTSSAIYGNDSEVGPAILVDATSQVAFDLCTIADNLTVDYRAFWAGLQANPPTTVRNSILWGNKVAGGGVPTTAEQISNHTLATYSVVQGIWATGTGNTMQDPLFLNPAGLFGDPATADYSLASGSPAIDSGNNDNIPAGQVRDVNGDRRRYDELTVADTGIGSAPVVDRGAYEFNATIGEFYCVSVPNSSGQAAEIFAQGSLVVSDNNVTLEARYVPTNSMGFFLTSSLRAETTSPTLPGVLCLGNPIGRLAAPGQIVSSGADGRLVVQIDLTQHPLAQGTVAVQPGESWHFQAWFRDIAGGGLGTGLTDGLTITFE